MMDWESVGLRRQSLIIHMKRSNQITSEVSASLKVVAKQRRCHLCRYSLLSVHAVSRGLELQRA